MKINFKIILVGLSFLYSLSTLAQGNDRPFTPMRTQSQIPSAVFVPTQTKIDQAQKEASTINYKSIDQKSNVNSFLINSNYEIDYLLRSGKILFDNDITAYLESILDLVLSNEPQLRDRIHVYLLKSSEVNAYATQQGYIFVSIGLLAQLENEAQLAFILAHESQHISGKHGITYVLDNSKKGNNNSSGNETVRQRKMSSLEYSRNQETEADTASFRRAMQAGYRASSAISSMDILQLSFIPFTNTKFNFNEIETEDFKIPDWAIADSVEEIPLNTDESDDTYSTHPRLELRRNALKKLAEDFEGGKNYLVSKESFENTVRECRFEIIFLHLVEGDYASSLYISNVLLQKYPNNQFLEEAFAKSLYGIYAYRVNNKKNQVNFNTNKHYGEMQRMSLYFGRIKTIELGLIAFRTLYDVEQKYHNPFITHVLDDLIGMFSSQSKKTFEDLIQKKNYSADLVSKGMNVKHEVLIARIKSNVASEPTSKKEKTPAAVNKIKSKQEDTEESEEGSKYDRLRANRGEKSAKKETEYTSADAEEVPDWLDHYIYMLLQNVNESELNARFDSVSQHYSNVTENQKNWEKEYAAQQRKYNRKGFELGLDSLLIIDPYYVGIKVTKKNVRVENVDNNQMEFAHLFQSYIDNKSFHGHMLAWETMNETDTIPFNELSEMNDWYEEIKKHVENDVDMVALTTDYFYPILNNYHCRYVIFPGAIRVHDTRYSPMPKNVLGYMSLMLAPTLVPALISKRVESHFYTDCFYYVYDLDTGTMIWHHRHQFAGNSNIATINLYFQDLLIQTIK